MPRSGQSVPVPVPVYCRPLTEKDPGMKIWCAAGVNLTGGCTNGQEQTSQLGVPRGRNQPHTWVYRVAETNLAGGCTTGQKPTSQVGVPLARN